jgi:HSP20 family protein
MARSLRPWRGTGIRPLDDLYREMDSLVHQFFSDDNGTGTGREFVPTLNVSESEAAYEVTVDLPGLKPEDVSVEVHENQLTISGKRAFEQEEKGSTFHRIERRSGEFRRVIALPAAVDEAKISADYQQGVLKVTLPKSEKVRPTRIAVNAP